MTHLAPTGDTCDINCKLPLCMRACKPKNLPARNFEDSVDASFFPSGLVAQTRRLGQAADSREADSTILS